MRKRLGIFALLAGAVVAVRRRRWFPVRVEGTSMLPTLQPGDFLAVRALRADEPREGQLVVVRFGGLEVVKRVKTAGRELAPNEFWVEGDNAAASTDSRVAGPVARDVIVGIVRARYKPIRSARTF